MDDLVGYLQGFFKSFISVSDDDWVDRLSRQYTGLLLVVSSFFLFSYAVLKDPINCWQTEGASDQDSYINNICWISNTYWVPFNESIPQYPGSAVLLPEREKMEISYYQWVTIVLLIQALFFYMPRFIWKVLSSMSGLNMNEIFEEAGHRAIKGDELKSHVENIWRAIDRGIDKRRVAERSTVRQALGIACFLCYGQSTGVWLFVFYLVVKVFYAVNATVQLVLLNKFLQVEGFYGFQLLYNVTQANATHVWRETGAFPRVTMCDFFVRRIGNLHRHSVQCVLPVNMFNEKVYVFLWLWIFMVAIVTILGLAKWIVRMFLHRKSFCSEYLSRLDGVYRAGRRLGGDKGDTEARVMERFVDTYLQTDGIFVLMMLKDNAGFYVFSHALKSLWTEYKRRYHLGARLKSHLFDHGQSASQPKRDGPMADDAPVKV